MSPVQLAARSGGRDPGRVYQTRTQPALASEAAAVPGEYVVEICAEVERGLNGAHKLADRVEASGLTELVGPSPAMITATDGLSTTPADSVAYGDVVLGDAACTTRHDFDYVRQHRFTARRYRAGSGVAWTRAPAPRGVCGVSIDAVPATGTLPCTAAETRVVVAQCRDSEWSAGSSPRSGSPKLGSRVESPGRRADKSAKGLQRGRGTFAISFDVFPARRCVLLLSQGPGRGFRRGDTRLAKSTGRLGAHRALRP